MVVYYLTDSNHFDPRAPHKAKHQIKVVHLVRCESRRPVVTFDLVPGQTFHESYEDSAILKVDGQITDFCCFPTNFESIIHPVYKSSLLQNEKKKIASYTVNFFTLLHMHS